MENNSQGVTKNKETTLNSKDKSNYSNSRKENNKALALGASILGVGTIITGLEAGYHGIPNNFKDLFSVDHDMLATGLGTILFGLGTIRLGGYRPITGIVELIGELTCLPYNLTRKAYQSYKNKKKYDQALEKREVRLVNYSGKLESKLVD